jgi:hypothetical protein
MKVSNCTRDAENAYTPLMMASIGDQKTVHQNGSTATVSTHLSFH